MKNDFYILCENKILSQSDENEDFRSMIQKNDLGDCFQDSHFYASLKIKTLDQKFDLLEKNIQYEINQSQSKNLFQGCGILEMDSDSQLLVISIGHDILRITGLIGEQLVNIPIEQITGMKKNLFQKKEKQLYQIFINVEDLKLSKNLPAFAMCAEFTHAFEKTLKKLEMIPSGHSQITHQIEIFTKNEATDFKPNVKSIQKLIQPKTSSKSNSESSVHGKPLESNKKPNNSAFAINILINDRKKNAWFIFNDLKYQIDIVLDENKANQNLNFQNQEQAGENIKEPIKHLGMNSEDRNPNFLFASFKNSYIRKLYKTKYNDGCINNNITNESFYK